jgi:hypothetical protein
VPLAKESLANLTNQNFVYPKNRKAISRASFFALANGFRFQDFTLKTAPVVLFLFDI